MKYFLANQPDILWLRISLVVFPRIRVFDGRFIGLVYRFFEASDGFAERFAQLGELAWTENHQGNYKNNDQPRHTKASEHTTPPDEEIIRLTLRGKGCQSGVSCHLKSNPRRYRRVIYKSNLQRRVGIIGTKTKGNSSELSIGVIAKPVFW